MTEFDAETLLVSLLSVEAIDVSRQFRLGGKIVDVLVAWPGDGVRDELETIEVKLRDWRRAAAQAYVTRAYVGRASIAMPASARRQVDEDLFRELGIGLIEFDAQGWRRAIEPAFQDADPEVVDQLRAGMASGA